MALARSGIMRANAAFISDAGFRQRKAYFAAKVGAGRRMAAAHTRCAQDAAGTLAVSCSARAGAALCCPAHAVPLPLPARHHPLSPAARTLVCFRRRWRRQTWGP